jgi:hypothetical protein
MRSKLILLSALVLSIAFNNKVNAQTKPIASANKPAANKQFKLFFEKAYLHTDREYYANGDDLWFKAYLTNGENNMLIYTSKNLYVDLISPDSKLLAREIIRLDNGTGTGDFKLTDSIPGGTYHLRAYTNWMRNFGDNFIFDKKITINSTFGIKTSPGVIVKVKPAKKPVVTVPAVVNTSHINFFPEGGSMIEGVAGVIGFKAEDAMGNGVTVNGSVVTSQGDTVAHFQSTASGMGSFTLMPMPNTKYNVKGVFKGNRPFNASLPAVLSQGFALHINNADTSFIQVTLSANQATFDAHKGKQLTIVAKHADKIYYSGKFTLTDAQAAVNIPKAGLPAGVASVIVYDEQLRPNCERLVYINSANPVNLSIVTDKGSYDAKGQTNVNIAAADAAGKPVKANLSVAVVDNGIVPNDEVNIVSYLMLQSEIRGRIQNSAQYFDKTNPARFKQLDLLLLTQGWRDFVWKRLADSTLKLTYLPEDGFTISGRLRQVLFNKAQPNMNITLFAPGAKGNKMFIAKTDSAGRYFLDGIELYGNQTLKITAKDNKGKKTGWVLLDTNYNAPLAINQEPVFTEEPSPQLAAFNSASAARRLITKRSSMTETGIQLKEVTIREAPKTVITATGEVYQSFGYPEYAFQISPKDYTYRDLEDYLIRNVPGAQANTDSSSGVVFYYGGKKVFPHFYFDHKEDVFDRLDFYALTMDQINSVTVRHMVNMGGGDVELVYLSLKPSAMDKKEFNMLNSNIVGYYSARTFYAPNYESPTSKPDQRTTIYWEPALSTDATGKAQLSFYNGDLKTPVRVVVQGISDNGVPLYGITTYNVK